MNRPIQLLFRQATGLMALWILFWQAAPVLGQDLQVGHRSMNFTDSARNNRNISAEVYYPALVGGDETPVAEGTFPIVVFGHGFVMTWSAYEVYWSTLVPQGYILVFATTETSISPSHSDFGADLAFLATRLKIEGNQPASAFFGKISPKAAVMGHSMGGGASFLAAAGSTVFDGLATVAAAVTSPSSISAASQVNIPALVFAGSNDCVTPPPQHQIPMFDSLQSDCKTYISIAGASHCQFAGYNFFCSVGEATCTPGPAISASVQQETLFSLLTPWLNFVLKDSHQAASTFQALLSQANGIESSTTCNFPTNQLPSFRAISVMEPAPNPFTESTSLFLGRQVAEGRLTLFSCLGQAIRLIPIRNTSCFVLNRDGLSPGIYYLWLEEHGKITGLTKVAISE